MQLLSRHRSRVVSHICAPPPFRCPLMFFVRPPQNNLDDPALQIIQGIQVSISGVLLALLSTMLMRAGHYRYMLMKKGSMCTVTLQSFTDPGNLTCHYCFFPFHAPTQFPIGTAVLGYWVFRFAYSLTPFRRSPFSFVSLSSFLLVFCLLLSMLLSSLSLSLLFCLHLLFSHLLSFTTSALFANKFLSANKNETRELFNAIRLRYELKRLLDIRKDRLRPFRQAK